jgi:hypothetical protein
MCEPMWYISKFVWKLETTEQPWAVIFYHANNEIVVSW